MKIEITYKSLKKILDAINKIDRDCKLVNIDNKIYRVPIKWSENSINILVGKYMRKSIPQVLIKESKSFFKPAEKYTGDKFTNEVNVIHVLHRIAGFWTYSGFKHGYFKNQDGMVDFYNEDEMVDFYISTMNSLFNQEFAPNSPQWFNTGLNWFYGINQDSTTPYFNIENDKVQESYELLKNPQVHACFILGIEDNLIGKNGIMETLTNESKIFKFGSGAGTNFSKIRGKDESLSGGGTSSGLMSFLKVSDASAGAIKSGGTTRRAAKMVCLDVDHPDILDFIHLKSREEDKVAMLQVGSHFLKNQNCKDLNSLQDRIEILKSLGINYKINDMDLSWTGDAYGSVNGQNANFSVRVTDEFINKYRNKEKFNLKNRVDKKTKEIDASFLMNEIAKASWISGDPALQFHDTINKFNPCKYTEDIVSSNPCSEYMFLNNTACNLASINLLKCVALNSDKTINIEKSQKLIDLIHNIITILDISVTVGLYPTKEIANGTLNYRTLGLGFSNLGALFVENLIAYGDVDSVKLINEISKIIQIESYRKSQALAKRLGAFTKFKDNEKGVYEVQKMQIGNVLDFLPIRNAQLTCIAPTGTIGLLMDCDTTGIEPLFSLSSYKSLAVGGYMTIIPQCVKNAICKIIDIYNIENNLDLKYTDIENKYDFTNFDNIKSFLHYLKMDKYLNIFKTAVGSYELNVDDHLSVMAECQKFISGAISKTINLPYNATIEDVLYVYDKAYDLGIKAITVFRDKSKLSQPLNQKNESKKNVSIEVKLVDNKNYQDNFNNPIKRKKLPSKRNGYTQKMKIGGHGLYLRTGEYDDGNLGEIFLDMYKEGNMTSSLLNAFSIAISLGLQHGVPLQEFIDAFTLTKFEPNGVVQGHDKLKMASSLLDLIFKDLAINYLNKKEYEHKIHENKEIIKADNDKDDKDICTNCGIGYYITTGTCKTCTNCGTSNGGCS